MILPAIPQNSPIAGPNRITSIWNQVFVAFKAALITNSVERVTTIQRNAIPTTADTIGKVIYNKTTLKLEFWDGVAWRTVTSV